MLLRVGFVVCVGDRAQSIEPNVQTLGIVHAGSTTVENDVDARIISIERP